MGSLVSIIIPIYKVELYLDKCISSVVNQTYKNIQIILVDDGSPDRCPQLCDDWATLDSRIKVIHKKNGGLSDARNVGLDIAEGEYVYFLDSDDFLELNTIEILMNEIIGFDVVSFNCVIEDENGSMISRYVNPASCLYLSDNYDIYKCVIRDFLGHKFGYEACFRLYRRDIIESKGIRFVDNNKIFAEDLCFNTCYYLSIKRIKSINNCLYHYIQRGDSIMSVDARKDNMPRYANLCKAVFDYGEKHLDKDFIRYFPAIFLGLFQIEGVIRKKGNIDKDSVYKMDDENKSFCEYWLRKAYYSPMLYRMAGMFPFLYDNWYISVWLHTPPCIQKINKSLIFLVTRLVKIIHR